MNNPCCILEKWTALGSHVGGRPMSPHSHRMPPLSKSKKITYSNKE
jgi:hypothetical protein